MNSEDNKIGTKTIKRIAIAGNPNVGKSTIFNMLTGLNQHTGNWTGKTVDTAKGFFESAAHLYTIYDIPGTYSLTSHSPEEEIARDFIKEGGCDATIVVCDATSIERNLILLMQIRSICKRMLVIVNLMDEAKRRSIKIDLYALSKELDSEVIGTSIKDKKSKKKICNALDRIFLKEDNENISTQSHEKEIKDIINDAERISQKVIITKNSDASCIQKADKFLTSVAFGYPLMALIFISIFWITVKGANYPSALLSDMFSFIGVYLLNFLKLLRIPEFFVGLLYDGVYRVLTWVISVMLPPMAIFFPFFTFLEDLGYLPRIAYNLDKPLCRCNACGKQALTMCMGLGCNAVGVTGTRIIDSKRERLLAILTNSLIPCNGRFPLILTISSIFFITSYNFSSLLTAFYLIVFVVFSIVITLLSTKILSLTILKGEPSSFTLELPPYRSPQLSKIIVRSLIDRTFSVLLRAISIAAPSGALLYLFSNIEIYESSIVSHLASFLHPIGVIMGLDGIILLSFLLAISANEIVLPIMIMAYTQTNIIAQTPSLTSMHTIFASNGWTALTALNVIIFSLFHFPCSTTLMTIKKETGSIKWTIAAFLLPLVWGIIICSTTNLIYNLIILL